MKHVTSQQLSPNALVKIASCLDVPRADLAKIAPANAGIPVTFGNANFLSWYWHYSNAVGGVTIHVRRRDAEQARQVLVAARAKIADILPPWVCSSCGQWVAGQWDACWQCGKWVDGTPTGPLAEEAAPQPAGGGETLPWLNMPRFVAAAAVAALTITLFRHGPILPSLLAPFVVFFVFLLWRFEPSSGWQSEPQQAAESVTLPIYDLHETRSEVSRANVQRAWQAAMLGILAFPPLGFYSMRLLWKIANRDIPMTRADVWRCWTAFVLNIPAILFCLLFVWELIFAVRDALI